MALALEAGSDRQQDDLAAAKAGDREAFARIVAAQYDAILRIAWRWTGNREDAEDVAQEVCIRLAGAIRSWRGDAAFATWLYALTLNAARDHGRRRMRERRLADAMMMHALVEGPAAREGEDDPAEELWRAVRELPDKQRDAVLLVHGEGLSHADAAGVMGCAEATVSWHIHEARKRLKRTMAAGGAT